MQWFCILFILNPSDDDLSRMEEIREDGGDMFLRNVSSHKNYTVPHPRKIHHSHRCENLKSYMIYQDWNK
jgi:hypothetical protein